MVTIVKNSVMPSPLETVREKIRDFNALPLHHPAVAHSHIEDNLPSDHIGCIRCFNLKQGGTFRERLVVLDDTQHICAYSILESPIPVQNYVATIHLTPVANSGSTSMQWTVQFDCQPEQEAELTAWIGNILQDGFGCIKNMLMH